MGRRSPRFGEEQVRFIHHRLGAVGGNWIAPFRSAVQAFDLICSLVRLIVRVVVNGFAKNIGSS